MRMESDAWATLNPSAEAVSTAQPDAPFQARVGDARELPDPDGSFDAALLLGPLYHLTEREDRVVALREASRVVRPGGPVFAVGISRFASVLDGVRAGYLLEAEFREIVERDLSEGQHRNPGERPGWFTTAFFHHPDELERGGHRLDFSCELDLRHRHLAAREPHPNSVLDRSPTAGSPLGVSFSRST
jgi:SAM-dependent methyltransferase